MTQTSKPEEKLKKDEETIYPGVNLENIKFEVGQEMGIKPKQKNKK